LAGSASAAGASFNYYKQGGDWAKLSDKAGNEKWQCDEDQQSPIDLRNDFKKVEIANDIRRYQYGNFFNRPREWVGSDTTVKIYENKEKTVEPGMYFQSHYAKEVLKASPEYEVLEFHFHHKSEHTIEGVHYDLEMHIVHVGTGTDAQKKNAFASAMGFIFDTTKAEAVDKDTEAAIDGFFDSLKLD
jgi:carbonic anhydrase